jgi:hypothetical protein
MVNNRILMILAAAAAFGCSENAVPPTAQSDSPILQASGGSKVVHSASAGSPDICSSVGDKPGCDANFSLTASQMADGSVTGQWVDRVSQVNGGGGTHVAVNCLNVIGNRAYVSGVITQGNTDQIGQLALTRSWTTAAPRRILRTRSRSPSTSQVWTWTVTAPQLSTASFHSSPYRRDKS